MRRGFVFGGLSVLSATFLACQAGGSFDLDNHLEVKNQILERRAEDHESN